MMRIKFLFQAFMTVVALLPATVQGAAPFDAIAHYDYGGSRSPLLAVAAEIRAAADNAEARSEVEAQLIEVISGECTLAGLQFCAEQLAWMGTARAVPALSTLLAHETSAPAALYALAAIPGPEASQVLIDALAEEDRKDRADLVHALGVRNDITALPTLVPLLRDTDLAVALASAHALGRLGQVEAIVALEVAADEAAADRDPALKPAFARAVLLGADELLARGAREQAFSVFSRYVGYTGDDAIRQAAFQGYLRAAGDSAPAIAMELLWGNVPGMEHVAIPFVRDSAGGAAVSAFLGNMRPEVQVMVIEALADRGDPSVLPDLKACFERPEFSGEAVLRAATQALGRLGGSETVDFLVAVGVGHPALEETVVSALCSLPGADVDNAISAALAAASDPTRTGLLKRALSCRNPKP